MQVRENPTFTEEYYAPDKRYIGNALQVFFTDGSATDARAGRFPDRPSPAPRRRHAGAGEEVRKLRWRRTSPPKQAERIKALFAKPQQLDALPVNELMAALVTNGSGA